jgi:putative ABC transport system substrate-binding protein
MRRRSFHVAMVAAIAWPDRLHVQRSKLPTVGYLANAAPQGFSAYVDAFRGGLAEMGFVESRDVDSYDGLRRLISERECLLWVGSVNA